MDVHGGARLAHLLGDADVVAVGVREQHRLDVAERAAAAGEELLELASEPGETGVDQRQPAAVLDDVEVHELVAEPVDAGGDLARHAASLRVRIRWTDARRSGTVDRPMARSHLYLESMPAGAGHSWVEARTFIGAPTNDQPRGR